jgi:hypothetical protein
MQVKLDAHNRLTCDGRPVSLQQLTDEVRTLASVNRTQHVVAIEADAATTYEAYFQMQDAIVGAYQQLRDSYARKHYGCRYAQCTAQQRTDINEYYPQRISETPIAEKGGAQ